MKRFETVSVEEAETADMCICMPWHGPHDFNDNIRGVCVGCGVAVRFRPYAPKRPPKVCIGCAPGWIAATRH